MFLGCEAHSSAVVRFFFVCVLSRLFQRSVCDACDSDDVSITFSDIPGVNRRTSGCKYGL